MAKKKPSKEEKEDMDRKARWGCVVCRKIDKSVITPAQIHHIRKGAGLGQRGSKTIPLLLSKLTPVGAFLPPHILQ